MVLPIGSADPALAASPKISISGSAKVLVFDIDGCVFDSDHRLHHLLEAHVDDIPIPQGVAVYKAIVYATHKAVPIFVTGRSERARAYTVKQLRATFDFDFFLLMRPNGDTTHDMLLKPKLLKDACVLPENIFMVFEDRASMVKEWRRLGVVCYQTAKGDF